MTDVTAVPQSPTALAHSGAEEALAGLITQVSQTTPTSGLPTAAEIEAARRAAAPQTVPENVPTLSAPPKSNRSASRQASAELRRAGRAPSTAGASTTTASNMGKPKRSMRSILSLLFFCRPSGGSTRRHHGKDGRYRTGVGATGTGIDGNLHSMADKSNANAALLHAPTAGVGANPITQQIVLSPDKELVAAAQAVVAAGSSPTGVPTDGAATPSEASAAKSEPIRYLLPTLRPDHHGRKCLVLDLDETLVHSSFKMIPQADYIVPVEIENQVHNVYVLKRPGVDEFMRRMGEHFEIVVFTASLSKYADPVLDLLDKHKVVHHRLFRESCYNYKGNYVKDLSQLGRDLRHTIIIDNSPASYILHPTNAVPITSWFNDPHDTELLDMIPFLEDLRDVDDVTVVLDSANDEDA